MVFGFLKERRRQELRNRPIPNEWRAILKHNVPVFGRLPLEDQAELMNEEFKALRAAEEAGTPTLLDTYGATNPAEFFAVATEAFFERPRALRARHPKLYTEFTRFFRQDPASYSSEPTISAST